MLRGLGFVTLLVAAVTRALGIVVKLNVEVNMFKKIILYLFRIIIIFEYSNIA